MVVEVHSGAGEALDAQQDCVSPHNAPGRRWAFVSNTLIDDYPPPGYTLDLDTDLFL